MVRYKTRAWGVEFIYSPSPKYPNQPVQRVYFYRRFCNKKFLRMLKRELTLTEREETMFLTEGMIMRRFSIAERAWVLTCQELYVLGVILDE